MHWEHLGKKTSKPSLIPADELAWIIGRHRTLKFVDLDGQTLNERVLKEVVGLPQLTTLSIATDQPLGEQWLQKLPQQSQLWKFRLNCPDLSPAGAGAILFRCPSLEELQLPDLAIDDAICDQILARPALRKLWISFPNKDRISSAAVRLAENFGGERLECLGPFQELDPQDCQRLILHGTKAGDLSVQGIPSVELHDPADSTIMFYRCGDVELTGAKGQVSALRGKRQVIRDSPLLEILAVDALQMEVKNCERLRILRLDNMGLRTSGKIVLEDLPALGAFDGFYPADGLHEALAQCPNLHWVELTLQDSGPAEPLLPLAKLKQLRTLVINSNQTDLNHVWFQELHELSQIENLVVLLAPTPPPMMAPDPNGRVPIGAPGSPLGSVQLDSFPAQLPASLKRGYLSASISDEDWQKFVANHPAVQWELIPLGFGVPPNLIGLRDPGDELRERPN